MFMVLITMFWVTLPLYLPLAKAFYGCWLDGTPTFFHKLGRDGAILGIGGLVAIVAGRRYPWMAVKALGISHKKPRRLARPKMKLISPR